MYRAGRWDYLGSMAEIAHYMAIVGYASYGPGQPSILDVGCGTGRLLKLLEPFGFGAYLGVDFSGEALAAAEALGIENARFELANFLDWEPSRRFDIIVLNESLYYAPDGWAFLKKSLAWLTDMGFVIVSMYRQGDVARIWSALDADSGVDVIESTTVQNAREQVWDIKAMRPSGR
jgi:trans-aconitate methyltransferase